MSGISLRGELFTLVRTKSLCGMESIEFLRHLRTQVASRHGERLLVVWDRSPIHRAAPVQEFLTEEARESVITEFLPPYAPDLNPDEGVWQHLKHVELSNVCCWNLAELNYELGLAIRRLRAQPHLIQSFFGQAGLAL